MLSSNALLRVGSTNQPSHVTPKVYCGLKLWKGEGEEEGEMEGGKEGRKKEKGEKRNVDY